MQKEIVFTIEQIYDGLPVKTVLSKKIGLSRREISRLKFTQGLLLNHEICRVTQTVRTGDEVTLIFPEKDTAHALRVIGKPDILYEDEDIVAVNKPAGMVCHPSHEHLDDDMGTLLQNYYGSGFTIRAVGRLDKEVSGIMIYAKNQITASRLSKERSEEKLHKEYLALTEGIFTQKKGTLTYSIAKESGRKTRKAGSEGKPCITDYQVEEEYDGYSLLRISIRTGRTHQIRAGMRYYGHTLLGDSLYEGDTSKIQRTALHCERVTLIQPFTHVPIDIHCPLPDDMQRLCR